MKIILVALVFNGLDLITGIVGAIRDGEQIKSSKLRDGLFKKVGFVFCYALGVFVDFTFWGRPSAGDLYLCDHYRSN